MKFISKTQKSLIPGIATLLYLTVTASLSAQISTSVIYDGSGPVNQADNWGGNLPDKSPNGGLISSTDSSTSSWTGNTWTTMDIRHTGGYLFDAADNGLLLNQGTIYELETDTNYSNVDLEISGELVLFSNTGTPSEMRIVSGRVETNTIGLQNNPASVGNIDMQNGLLHAGALSRDAAATINFLSEGSGSIVIDNQAGFSIGNLHIDFETGSAGSLVLGENNGSNTIGGVNFLRTNGNLSIDGVTSTDSSDFNITQDGTATTLALVPEPSTYALFAGMATLGLVLLRRRMC